MHVNGRCRQQAGACNRAAGSPLQDLHCDQSDVVVCRRAKHCRENGFEQLVGVKVAEGNGGGGEVIQAASQAPAAVFEQPVGEQQERATRGKLRAVLPPLFAGAKSERQVVAHRECRHGAVCSDDDTGWVTC